MLNPFGLIGLKINDFRSNLYSKYNRSLVFKTNLTFSIQFLSGGYSNLFIIIIIVVSFFYFIFHNNR